MDTFSHCRGWCIFQSKIIILTDVYQICWIFPGTEKTAKDSQYFHNFSILPSIIWRTRLFHKIFPVLESFFGLSNTNGKHSLLIGLNFCESGRQLWTPFLGYKDAPAMSTSSLQFPSPHTCFYIQFLLRYYADLLIRWMFGYWGFHQKRRKKAIGRTRTGTERRNK